MSKGLRSMVYKMLLGPVYLSHYLLHLRNSLLKTVPDPQEYLRHNAVLLNLHSASFGSRCSRPRHRIHRQRSLHHPISYRRFVCNSPGCSKQWHCVGHVRLIFLSNLFLPKANISYRPYNAKRDQWWRLEQTEIDVVYIEPFDGKPTDFATGAGRTFIFPSAPVSPT